MSNAMAPNRGEITAEGLMRACSVRGEPALTTTEIAKIANVSNDAARAQLKRLESNNTIDRETVGWGEQLWYVSDS